MYRTWIYHATEEPKIVNSDETEQYFNDGWADTPAKFIKTTDFGVDPEDSIGVQTLGETIEGVKDMLNGSLNLKEMDKDQLEEYAEVNFGVDLDKRKSIPNLIKEVNILIEGQENGDRA